MDVEGFQAKVSSTVERYGMGLSFPVALVSGGPDSVALLRVLVGLGTWPVVLHVDHGLRGGESRGDAEFVRDLCHKLGLDFEVREPKLLDGPGLQERARGVRYSLASELVRETGASTMATGHTADDIAETVLMNLARGSGLRGLTGIPPISGGVARPIIEVCREDVLGYLDALGQDYRIDPTNALPKYTRNRIRSEILPLLEELYLGAGSNVARTAGLLREDLDALEGLAARSVRRSGDEIVVPAARELHAAIRRHAVRHAYSELAPDSSPLDSSAIESVLKLSEGTLDLPYSVVAAARPGEEVALYKRRERPENSSVPLEEGEYEFAGWTVRVREILAPEVPPTDAGRSEVAYLDVDPGPYRLRLVSEGDVVQPLGLGGGKKVLKAMMDRKVPRDLRRLTPVVVDSRERIAWVAGGELGEQFALRHGTRRALRIEARGPWEA